MMGFVSLIVCSATLSAMSPQFPHADITLQTVVPMSVEIKDAEQKKDSEQHNVLRDPQVPTSDFLWFDPQDEVPLSAHSGEVMVYSYDPDTKKLTVRVETTKTTGFRAFNPLNKEERSAIAKVPGWIKPRLTMTLSYLSQEQREDLLAFIQSVTNQYTDAPFLDELFFALAWSSPEELTVERFSPLVFLRNAKTVYESAKVLPYASLSEKDMPFPHTELSLHVTKKGKAEEWTLSPWEYYMFVVHPRLDAEEYQLIAPYSGQPDTEKYGGTDWRTGIWQGTPYRKNYVTHRLLEKPYAVEDEKLSGTIPCYHQFKSALAPLSVISGERGDCLAEIAYHNHGTIILSSIAEDFSSKLLKNMLSYGKNGGVSRRILIVTKTGEIPANIAELYDKTVIIADSVEGVSIADFSADNMFSQEDGAESPVLKVDKVIVPETDDASVYAAISKNSADIETFLNNGGTLELHVGSADISDLQFPAGIHEVGKGAGNAVSVTGHPVFDALMSAATVAWDFNTYIRYGETPLADNETAFARAGFWTGKNVPLNISEAREAQFAVERSSQAIRVAYNHYGNCGENQDLLIASMRTGLFPVIGAYDSGEDHVWVEFLAQDSWIPMQTNWSDTSFDVDQLGRICMETKWNDYKGGKDISFIGAWRGDNALFNHTETYTDTVTLDLTVTDKNGKPADGATVLLVTENYYDHTQFSVTGYAVTDTDGRLTIPVGDSRNIYIQVSHKVLGSWPKVGSVSQVIKADEAKPGKTFSATVALPYEIPAVPNAPKIAEALFDESQSDAVLHMHALSYLVYNHPYGDRTVLLTSSHYPSAYLFAAGDAEKWLHGDAVSAQTVTVDGADILLPADTGWEIAIPVSGSAQRVMAYASVSDEEEQYPDEDTTDSTTSATSACSAVLVY